MTHEEQKPDGCGSPGCLYVVIGIAALFVIGIIWTEIFGDGDSSTGSKSDTPMTTLHADILVHDQKTCADGPMVKVSAGARGPEPAEFRPSNAPCRLVFEMEVPAGSNQYKVQVDNLPARIFYPDNIRTPGGDYKIEMTIYGN